MPNLRKMTLEDLPAVLAIENVSFPQPWSETMFRGEIANGMARCVVAEFDRVVVGYSCAAVVLDEMNLHVLAVAEENRGRGIARVLLDHLFRDARNLEARLIHLEVRATNHVARHLYETSGFREVGVRKGYYDAPKEDAVLYTADLSQIPQ